MANNHEPVTKSDLQAMEERILKAVASMNDVMQRQFHFVAEQLTGLHEKFESFQKDLDELIELGDTLENHERRIQRLERRRALTA